MYYWRGVGSRHGALDVGRAEHLKQSDHMSVSPIFGMYGECECENLRHLLGMFQKPK